MLTLCYLGDMLCSGRGCGSAIAARCCVAWGKFRKLLPNLTTRHLSPKTRNKVYKAWVCSAMLHGSETWKPNTTNLQQLRLNDLTMIQCICGNKDRDKTPSDSQLQKLGIITAVLCNRRLRWYGHIQHPMSCIKSVTDFSIADTRALGKFECTKTGVSICGLAAIDPQVRYVWRASVPHSLVLPIP